MVSTINRPHVAFDENKTLHLYDENGVEVPPTSLKDLCELIGGGKITKVETVTIMEIEGSCYWVFWIGNFPYVVYC